MGLWARSQLQFLGKSSKKPVFALPLAFTVSINQASLFSGIAPFGQRCDVRKTRKFSGRIKLVSCGQPD